jgi:trimethylamine:corrinoid methyltransferase-like protein
MGQKHTRRRIREIWLPELTHPAPMMAEQAPEDVRIRARQILKNILDEHQPEPLSKEVQEELKLILKAAKNENPGME